MNIVKKFSLVVALCMLVASLAWSQRVSTTIYATDHIGLDSVIIGTDPAATGHIDAALGEYELPPPTLTFDFRSVSLDGSDTLGYGAKINYHHQVTPTQTDTFLFQFQSDQYGDNVTFSWPADMRHVGAGYWVMLDNHNNFLCDMTKEPSFTYPNYSSGPQFVKIVMGDGLGFLTATYLDLANAKDSKGKGAGEKRKNYSSEGLFQFNNGTLHVKKLHVEFSQAVALVSHTPFDKVTNTDGKNKKWDLEFTGGDTLKVPTNVEIFATGDKGKSLQAKVFWWVPDSVWSRWKPAKLGPVNPSTGTDRLWLHMPNWNNVGEELYTEGAFPDPNGLHLGVGKIGTDPKSGKDILLDVIHPKKWGNVYKSLNSKGTTHIGGAPACLFPYAGSTKVKQLKGYDAAKQKNELVGALIALKFNIASSQYNHTEFGFGNLLYKAGVGDPAWSDGKSLSAIVAVADNYMSCYTTYPIAPGDTITLVGSDLLNIINRANAAFSGTFDTLSFGVRTVVKNARQLVSTKDVLYRNTIWAASPIVTPAYNYDAATPVEFKLNQNYPNPFNPTTTISFDLTGDAFVTLKVYNMLGQEVATLADHQEFTSGTNEVTFDASNFASGVYYYRVIVNDGEFQQVKKMMLLK